jgi:hypothetical protein
MRVFLVTERAVEVNVQSGASLVREQGMAWLKAELALNPG